MTLAYYPGCSLHGTSREFDESFRAVAVRPGHRPAGDRRLVVLRRQLRPPHQSHPRRGPAGAQPGAGRRAGRRRSPSHPARPASTVWRPRATSSATTQSWPPACPDILGRPFANDVAVRNVVDVCSSRAPRIEESSPRRSAAAGAGPPQARRLLRLPAGAPLRGHRLRRRRAARHDGGRHLGLRATPVGWSMAVECCGGAFSISRTCPACCV